jgi:hypothetical protein
MAMDYRDNEKLGKAYGDMVRPVTDLYALRRYAEWNR